MNPFKAVRLGWGRAWNRKRAVLLYWFFHTIMALTVALPLAGTGISLVAKTRYGDELLREFDVMFLAEALYRTGSLVWAMSAAAAALPALVVGVAYLNGGAWHVLRKQSEAYSPAVFWQGAGLYFWRFLRLSLYSLLAWIPFVLVRGALRLAAEKIWGDGMEEAPVYLSTQVIIAVSILLAGYAVTVVDFTRARLAAESSHSVLRTLVRTILWVARNPLLCMGPWAILGVLLGLVSAIYLKFSNWFPATVTPLIVIVIFVQQAYLLARVFLRFAGWGAVIEIDKAVWGDNESHEPEQEVFAYVGGGGDGSLRAGAEADPEAESPQAG